MVSSDVRPHDHQVGIAALSMIRKPKHQQVRGPDTGMKSERDYLPR